MTALKQLLTGYCDPVQLKISERPLGENGLTVRLAWIASLWETSVALRQRHCWRFGHVHFREVFGTFVAGVDNCWLTEVLRVMDHAKTKRGKNSVKNLTVELCHEVFQSITTFTKNEKDEETRRYDALKAAYDAAGLRQFRNQEMFHLDLDKLIQSGSSKTGNILEITSKLIEWYAHVVIVCFKAEPKFVTQAHSSGKRIAREFRRILMAGLRERIGKAHREKAKFKSAGWSALFETVANSADKDSLG